MVRELADLYGSLGGTLRDAGELPRAAEAYDAGFDYEVRTRGESPSTYNELNRLVTRVLHNPAVLADAVVSDPLESLRSRLQEELDGRRAGDVWAAGDLALVSALLGDQARAAEAISAFRSLDPPVSAREAYAAQAADLAALETPHSAALDHVRAAFLAD